MQNSETAIDARTIDGYHTGINNQSVHGLENETPLKNVSDLVPHEAVAVCGMSVRLPGGIHTPQQLWNFLVSKGDARSPVPKSRYNASAYHSATSKPGSVKSEYGYFLDESIDIASIDTSFFGMGKSETERADPQQRQMLEVARECMEDAGETKWKGRSIGCFMGSFGEDWVEMFAKENQQYGQHRVAGYGDFMLANRVSYEMNLTGPRYVVKAPLC
jgi:acyl transferase domain-containing protein